MQIFITEFKKIIIPLCIFFVFFVIDLITGIIKGKYIEGIQSEKLRATIPKFCGYVGMLLMSYFLDCLILTSTDINYSPISLISIIFFCITEVKSIVENAQILGVKTPTFITDVINALSEKFSKKE